MEGFLFLFFFWLHFLSRMLWTRTNFNLLPLHRFIRFFEWFAINFDLWCYVTASLFLGDLGRLLFCFFILFRSDRCLFFTVLWLWGWLFNWWLFTLLFLLFFLLFNWFFCLLKFDWFLWFLLDTFINRRLFLT